MLYWYSHAHLLAHVVILLVLVLLLGRERTWIFPATSVSPLLTASSCSMSCELILMGRSLKAQVLKIMLKIEA